MKKNATPPAWLRAALDYLPQWLDLQLERYRQPGCSVPIARGRRNGGGAGVGRGRHAHPQTLDRRPFLSRAELLADLRAKPPLEAGVQLKYSNHGYGLLGLMMEQVTGTDYATWMQRHVIAAAGLEETAPDMPHLPRRAPLAVGHSSEFPFGQRLIVPGDNPCDAMAPAAGFVSTA